MTRGGWRGWDLSWPSKTKSQTATGTQCTTAAAHTHPPASHTVTALLVQQVLLSPTCLPESSQLSTKLTEVLSYSGWLPATLHNYAKAVSDTSTQDVSRGCGHLLFPTLKHLFRPSTHPSFNDNSESSTNS